MKYWSVLHWLTLLGCTTLLASCVSSKVVVSSQELNVRPLTGRTVLIAPISVRNPEHRIPPSEEQAILQHLADRLKRRSKKLQLVLSADIGSTKPTAVLTLHVLTNEVSTGVSNHSSTSTSTETCTDENGKTHTHEVSSTSYETWATTFRCMSLMYQLTDSETHAVLWQANGDYCPGNVNSSSSETGYPDTPRFNGPPEPSKVANAITTNVIRKLPVK